MKATDQPIIVEEFFKVSGETLWKAITELEQMKQWFFENIEAFEPKVGFETKFIVENEGRIFPHLWKITEVEPLKKITYNWRYEGYKGNSFLTFEIVEEREKTKLILVHTVTEDFPQDIPEFKRESCLSGWDYFIKLRLKDYLSR
jgi:uncharacterized protein YndB with AHSA1/START domain